MTFDGRRHTVEIVNPLGHPDNPMQDRHVEEKFMALAEPVLGPERCRSALNQWWRVSDAEDVSRLLQLLDLEGSGAWNLIQELTLSIKADWLL